MATTTWVEFRAVKQSVTMRMALDHYQIKNLRQVKDELRGRCPIHKGEGSEAFHISISKNCFQCFSCKKSGNVLDFVAAMENCSVRDAAVKLAEWFSISTKTNGKSPERSKALDAEPQSGGEGQEENKPLTFELKNVDPAHPYLKERGLKNETVETFGPGYFSGKGSMSGRVVIPIHNKRGELVAYAGRSIDGSEPKYKLPPGFQKSLELFNLGRVKARRWGNDLEGLVVMVEGFFDCMKIWQAGLPVVALMGCSLSEAQAQLLAEHFVEVLLMLDGDAAGREAAPQIAGRLASKVWIKDLVLAQGKQPDQLSTEELNELFYQAL